MIVGFPNLDASRPATMPTTPGCHPCFPSTMAGKLARAGSSSIASASAVHGPLDLLAARAEVLDLGGDPARVDVARRQKEGERMVRLCDPSGRVDARGEPEGHVLARGRADRAARDLDESARARAGPASQEAKAGAHEGSVVTVERGHVADGADGDEIEPLAHIEGDAELGTNARRNREREPDRGKPLVGEPTLGSMRVEERKRGKRGVRHAVMVDDHGVEPGGADRLEALVIARPAVARDEQRGAGVEYARERRRRQPVAPVEAVREQRSDGGAERPEHVGDQRGGGDSVGVVVPEDADGLLGAHGPRDPGDRFAPILHRVGRREVREAGVEKPRRLVGLEHAARDEHGGGRSRDPQGPGELDRVLACGRGELQHRAQEDPRPRAVSMAAPVGRRRQGPICSILPATTSAVHCASVGWFGPASGS